MMIAMGRTIQNLLRQFDKLETHELMMIVLVVIVIGIIVMWQVGRPQ